MLTSGFLPWLFATSSWACTPHLTGKKRSMALYSCSCSVGYTWDLFLHYSGTVSIVAPFFHSGNDLVRRFPLPLHPKASRTFNWWVRRWCCWFWGLGYKVIMCECRIMMYNVVFCFSLSINRWQGSIAFLYQSQLVIEGIDRLWRSRLKPYLVIHHQSIRIPSSFSPQPKDIYYKATFDGGNIPKCRLHFLGRPPNCKIGCWTSPRCRFCLEGLQNTFKF